MKTIIKTVIFDKILIITIIDVNERVKDFTVWKYSYSVPTVIVIVVNIAT